MILTRKQVKVIQGRIEHLENEHFARIHALPVSYSELLESEKIPLRVPLAEIRALELFMVGSLRSNHLELSVSAGHYCGAAGIALAIEWLSENNFQINKLNLNFRQDLTNY
jgi:hypothetical protein